MAKLPNVLQLSFGICKPGTVVDLKINENCPTNSLQGLEGRFTVTERDYEKGKDGQTFLKLKDNNSAKQITLGWRQNSADIAYFTVLPVEPVVKPEKTGTKRLLDPKDIQHAIQLVNDLEGRVKALEASLR